MVELRLPSNSYVRSVVRILVGAENSSAFLVLNKDHASMMFNFG